MISIFLMTQLKIFILNHSDQVWSLCFIQNPAISVIYTDWRKKIRVVQQYIILVLVLVLILVMIYHNNNDNNNNIYNI